MINAFIYKNYTIYQISYVASENITSDSSSGKVTDELKSNSEDSSNTILAGMRSDMNLWMNRMVANVEEMKSTLDKIWLNK